MAIVCFDNSMSTYQTNIIFRNRSVHCVVALSMTLSDLDTLKTEVRPGRLRSISSIGLKFYSNTWCCDL